MDRPEEPPRAQDDAPVSGPETPSRKFLSWPPPGLEAAQGKLWPITTLIALGDTILILPLLWAAASEQELWSFGPFGDSVWVPFLAAVIGFVVLLYGLARLVGLLRLATKAGKHGHGWLMVIQVAADFPRDTGFLLQGARIFSELPPAKRGLMLASRMVGAGAYASAALWVPAGFAISILLGTRGLLGPAGVWFVTLAPTALLLLVGLLSRILGQKLTWETRRDRTLRAAVDQEVRTSVAEWNDQSSAIRQELGFGGIVAGSAKSFSLGILGVVLLAVLVLVPVSTVTMTGTIGAVLAAIAIPGFDHAQSRMAVLEILRPYRLESDGSTAPEQAGEALHALLFATVDSDDRTLSREPVRVYRQAWFPEDSDSVVAESSQEWALGLFERVRQGLGRDEREYLSSVAAHPAHAEFGTIAMADSIDIIGTRYALPFPDTVTPVELPTPRFIGVKNGTDAHIARAAWQFSQGRQDLAEATLKEVVSLGFLLVDDGPTIIDGMIGNKLVHDGTAALELLYRASGRTRDAEDLLLLKTGITAVLDRASVARAAADPESALRMMPSAVLDDKVMRGVRWEYFMTFTTLAPCVSLNKVVFGPGQSFEQWLADAEKALVRRPSDEEMFRFLEGGWFRGSGGAEAPGWIRAALRLTFGGAKGGSCAAQLGGMGMVGVL